MEWFNIIGSEWHKLLKPFVESKEMLQIINNIKNERKKYVIYPEQKEFYKMFKIFKDLQPSDIKIVLLSQDPFPNGCGTGYSFCNNGKLPSDISPSLKNILKEIENSDVDKAFELDKMDLSRWVKQGVFLANAYLTVRKNNPGKHKFWDTFTKYWISKLAKSKEDVIWLLLGNFAQSYEVNIKNKICDPIIIKTSHPSPLGFTKTTKTARAFKDSKCFKEINNNLWIMNKQLIKW